MSSTLIPYLQSLRAAMLDVDPDLDADDKLWLDSLDGQTNGPDILRRIVRRALELEVQADALKAYRRELDDREERLRTRAQHCRMAVGDGMEALSLKRLDGPEFVATVQASRPGVRVTDLAALPEQYKKTEVKPMLALIYNAIREGETVPGAELANTPQSLVIRGAKP